MKNVQRVPFMVAWLLLTAFAYADPGAAETKSLSDMTGSWQLFVDDHLISMLDNTTRSFHPFKKYEGNPVVKPDKPWEKDSVKLTMVLPNEERTGFRMWYGCKAPKNDKKGGHALYAVSKDGVTWEKPNLGLIPWSVNGSTDNNMVSFTGCVVHSPWNPPDSRYTSITPGSYRGVNSPDGFQVTQTSESLVKGGDVGRFCWDPNTRKYLGFVKVGRDVRGLSRRCVGYSDGANHMVPWPPLRLCLAPDDYDDRWVEEEGSIQRTHFYGMTPFAYESIYVAFLWIFRATDDNGYFYGPLYTEIVTSPDGTHRRRQDPPRTPVIDLGPPGSWDDGMVLGGGLVVDGGQLKAYYTGYDDTHDIVPMHNCIGLATMRKDGFASIDAGAEVGRLKTKRLSGIGGLPLRVNCDTTKGWLRVIVLDENDEVVPGYNKNDCAFIRGDNIDTQVTWEDHDVLPVGHPSLRLLFLMQNASVYSFMVGDKVQVIEDEPAKPTLAVLYTFEKNEMYGSKLSAPVDVLLKDGEQKATVNGKTNLGIELDSKPENAAFGKNSMLIKAAFTPRCTVEIDGTRELGKHFTLALMAKSSDNKHARLFSSYDDFGPCRGSELVFDCDPTGTAVAGLRLIAQGISVESKPLNFADGKYHHLAVVYENGKAFFYLDGAPVGEQWIGGDAPVILEHNLQVGEDTQHAHVQQFKGNMDDILVLDRALSAAEIKAISQQGAEAFFKQQTGEP